MSCFVYHICRESDKFDFSKGYVGISSNPLYRWERHKKYEKAGLLTRAYNKYNDIIEYIVMKGSREFCLFMELKLRPYKRIGWNIMEGGGNPPSHEGKIMSQTQKDNIGKSNSGSNGPSWKGYWIVDGTRYTTTKDVAAVYDVTTKTVCDRAKNPKFPTWSFEPVSKGRR